MSRWWLTALFFGLNWQFVVSDHGPHSRSRRVQTAAALGFIPARALPGSLSLLSLFNLLPIKPAPDFNLPFSTLDGPDPCPCGQSLLPTNPVPAGPGSAVMAPLSARSPRLELQRRCQTHKRDEPDEVVPMPRASTFPAARVRSSIIAPEYSTLFSSRIVSLQSASAASPRPCTYRATSLVPLALQNCSNFLSTEPQSHPRPHHRTNPAAV